MNTRKYAEQLLLVLTLALTVFICYC